MNDAIREYRKSRCGIVSEKSTIALGTILILAVAPVSLRFAGADLPFIIVVEAALLIGLWIIGRYLLLGEEQSRHLAHSSVAVIGIFSIAAAGASYYYQLLDKLLILLMTVLRFDQPSIDAIQESMPRDGISELTIVAITILVCSTLLNFERKEAATSSIDRPLSNTDVDAIRQGVKVQIARLQNAASFLPQIFPLLPTRIERADSSSARLLQPNLIKRVLSAAKRELIILKGEPGSGKSVALRALADEAASKMKPSDRIPIHLNLRDWTVGSEEMHEIEQSFMHWTMAASKTQISAYLARFLDESQFNEFYAAGRFLFLFDSFDEIPAIVDRHHESALLVSISSAIAGFIKASGGCVAVIASRSYKAPVLRNVAHSTYVVKAFDDAAVKAFVESACKWPDFILSTLYTGRRDLFVLSRNPFLLTLLVQFVNEREGLLPSSEYELYETFISGRLTSSASVNGPPARPLAEEATSAAEILASEMVANAVPFLETHSLEGLVEADVLNVLLRSRIVSVSDDRIRFTHRRFLEFFKVRQLLSGGETRPALTAGYLDSNRDLLNLYGGICPDEDAAALVAEAVGHLRGGVDGFEADANYSTYEEALLALRFLRDTFRARLQLLRAHDTSIHGAIIDFWNTEDLMKQKHAAEHLCLLPTPVATTILAECLSKNSAWLERVALSEARYIDDLQPWMGMKVCRHASKASDFDHWYLRYFLTSTHSMQGGNLADKMQLNIDSASRAIIVTSLMYGLLAGSTYISTLLIFSLAFLLLERITASSFQEAHQRFAASGYNAGFSGQLASIGVWLLLWALVHFLLSQNYLDASRLDRFVASFFLLVSCLVMMTNNMVSTYRENCWKDNVSAGVKYLLQRLEIKAGGWGLIRRYWITAIVLFLLIGATFWQAISNVHQWWRTIVFGGILALFGYGIALWIKTIAMALLDRFTAKRLKRGFLSTRSAIELALAELRTDAARERFVRWVDTQPYGELTSANDDWIGGVRPRFTKPELNNYLAILDERWRGLNRR